MATVHSSDHIKKPGASAPGPDLPMNPPAQVVLFYAENQSLFAQLLAKPDLQQF
ncbi:hypothetical protein [Paenibacillus xylanexedens]|uniref:hypothetical protein n=1 Tax=Paenibacillus xylanexedens TaxID=528191 RepID=UPI001643D80A|nr:hypothetical protein [Paenibacillus xylanexedens]